MITISPSFVARMSISMASTPSATELRNAASVFSGKPGDRPRWLIRVISSPGYGSRASAERGSAACADAGASASAAATAVSAASARDVWDMGSFQGGTGSGARSVPAGSPPAVTRP